MFCFNPQRWRRSQPDRGESPVPLGPGLEPVDRGAVLRPNSQTRANEERRNRQICHERQVTKYTKISYN